MANSSPDILEITAVYGTQAVFIKEEVDEGDTKDFKEDITINDDTLRHGLLSVPIVYTTRLDKMNAFKKIKKLASKEATEMILIESKPQYEQTTEQIKREHHSDSYITSYIQLCSHVQEFNTKVRFEAYNTYLRNEKLMKMCKPLKIVLEDIKKNKVKFPSIKIDDREFREVTSDEATQSHIFSDVVELSSWSSDISLTKSKSHKFRKSKAYKDTSVTTLAIKHKISQKADIYILNAIKGVKSYYKTNIKECNRLQKRHLSIRTIILEYCCWLNREKCVKHFIQTYFAGASLSNFLRKPHNCSPICTCCCVTPITKKHSDRKCKQSNKKTLKEVRLPGNVLIEKAYVYFNKEFNTVQNNIKPQRGAESTIYLKGAVIIFKYQGVIFAQAELLGENYEIGDNGDIDHFLKPTVNRSIIEEKELYKKKYGKRKVRQYFSYMICCWHLRETIIVQLRDCNNLSPNAFKFMRNPHLCKSDKCECCCKPAPILSMPSKIVTFTTQKNIMRGKKQIKAKKAKPGKNETKHSTSPSRSFEEHNMETQNLERTEKVKKRTTEPSQTVTISSKKPKVTQNFSQNDKNCIDWNIDSSFRSNPIPTNPPNCHSSNYTDTKQLPTITPGNLISDIIFKFKGLKLALNEKGKLTAMINTHPSQLSAEEIKVLSDILSLATTQIQKLGITPEEFCKLVNSTATDGPSSSIIPPLVPILDSDIVNNATMNKNDRRMPELLTSNFTNKTISSQNVTIRDPHVCKAHSLNISFPKTHNISTTSGFYQIMSSLGGIKNQHLVYAYKHHFKDKNADIQENPTMLPHIAEVYSLVDNGPIVKSKKARAPARHKNLLERKASLITSTHNNLDNMNYSQPVIGADNDTLPLLGNTNLIPIHNTIGTDVSESVMEAHNSKIQHFVSNGNLIKIHNTTNMVVQQPKMGADLNPPPLFISNTNIIAMQNANGTKVLESVMNADHHNQMPLFVQNSNLVSTHSTIDKDIQQPMVEANVNRPLHFVSNSNYIPIQNNHSQIHFFVSNGNLIPILNTSGQDVPPAMEADYNQTIPCVTNNTTNSNIIPNPNTIKKNIQNTIGMDIAESNADNAYRSQSPGVRNANPGPSDTVAPGMLTVARKTSTPSDNPLLYQMLAKTQSILPHRLPALAPLSTPRSNAAKHIGRPVILAHSKGSKIQKAQRKILKAPNQLKENAGIDIELDFESSLETNVKNIVKPDQALKDEVSPVLNNIPIILINDDEEEGIFGI